MRVRLIESDGNAENAHLARMEIYSGLPDHVGRQIGQEVSRVLERVREVDDHEKYDPVITIEMLAVQR